MFNDYSSNLIYEPIFVLNAQIRKTNRIRLTFSWIVAIYLTFLFVRFHPIIYFDEGSHSRGQLLPRYSIALQSIENNMKCSHD